MQLTNATSRIGNPIIPVASSRLHRVNGHKFGHLRLGAMRFQDGGAAGAPAGSGGEQKPEGGDGGEQKPDAKPKVEFTPEQQAELNRIVAREAKAAAAKAKADADQARKDADADAARKKETDDAAAKGEFDKARTQMEADLTTEKDKVTTLTQQNADLVAAMKVGVDARWNDLPERVRKTGEKVAPDENDVLGRWAYLNDPDTVEWVKEIAKAEPPQGNGPNPKPAGPTGTEIKSLISKQQAGFSGTA